MAQFAYRASYQRHGRHVWLVEQTPFTTAGPGNTTTVSMNLSIRKIPLHTYLWRRLRGKA